MSRRGRTRTPRRQPPGPDTDAVATLDDGLVAALVGSLVATLDGSRVGEIEPGGVK
jgi:hypothetical protein